MQEVIRLYFPRMSTGKPKRPFSHRLTHISNPFHLPNWDSGEPILPVSSSLRIMSGVIKAVFGKLWRPH
ncbi:hypothetical protein OIDMADRAFT_19202 [Oidiodendron maius Zn]|uniref:Uncharacterized protein n=1 Tax=Oidiodendron maius (strain Zn) TaxID=913774 RepID=A0A0C3HG25_OIDMZ|nr:hypothetical protein OIDMADRAFT_19202 [Oidiodendron maius Zn]